MTSHDISLSLIPKIFTFLIHVSVGGPLVVIVTYIFITVLLKWLISSILCHFKVNADISVLEKTVILGLPFCVFAGYSVLTYANDSLTYRLPNGIKTIKQLIWKAFS